MRNIKFRAWIVEHDLMVYSTDVENNTFVLSDGFFTVDLDCGEIRKDYDVSTTTMQYTGLHDKNGKEIYEGDIVYEYNCNIPNVISYVSDVNEGLGMDCGWYCQRDNFESWSMLNSGDVKYIEVVGNIYENPELLKYK